jgi:hypothetical protein
MAKMKKSRAFMSLLLSILLLLPFASCDGGEIEGTEQILNPDIGLRGGLLIAGKNAEAKEPEIKSTAYLALDNAGKKLYDSAYTALTAHENTFKLTGIDLKPYGEAYAYEQISVFYLRYRRQRIYTKLIYTTDIGQHIS